MFKELKIERFGLHEKTEFQFKQPVALFIGQNEHGKSTIRQAARFLLDGEIVDEELMSMVQKQFHGHFIRNKGSASNFLLTGTVWLNGKDHVLTRKRTNSATSGSPAAEINREILNCLFNTKYYPRMSINDRAALWFRVLGLELSMEDLKKEINKRIPSASVLPKTQLHPIFQIYEKKGFNAAEKDAVDLRRFYKRELETLPKLPPEKTAEIDFAKDGKTETKTINLTEHSADGVDAILANENARLNDLLEQRRKLEGAEANSIRYIRDGIKNARTQIKELTAEVEKLKTETPEIETLEAERTSTIEQWEAIRTEIQALETEIDAIEKLLPWTEDCPLYPGAKCRSKGQIEKIFEDRRKSLGGLKRSRTAKQRNHDALKKKIEEISQSKAAASENARLYFEKTSRLAYYEAELERLEKAEKDAKPFPKKDAEKLEAVKVKISNLAGRIDAYSDLHAKLLDYEAAVEEFTKKKEKESELQSQLNAADAIAAALGTGPKSIQAQLSKAARNRVNDVLKIFHSLLDRPVSLDENLAIQLGDVPYEHLLSHSARRRLGIAIQSAIAELTGLKFLAIDDLENLDPGRRNLMIATAINLARNNGFQVWCFSSLGTREVDLIRDGLPIESVDVYLVEFGRVSKLNAK